MPSDAPLLGRIDFQRTELLRAALIIASHVIEEITKNGSLDQLVAKIRERRSVGKSANDPPVVDLTGRDLKDRPGRQGCDGRATAQLPLFTSDHVSSILLERD
jgi:hypothetical protein